MSPLDEAPLIPGYRIEGVLGHGATGVVYRARQLSVDRVVALKVLHRELVGARRAEQRLQREARTTARLAHPNIISAIDMGEIGGVWWYAMELVDGVSLHDRLRDEGPLSEREALRLFIPLVEALQHAFERGVVHRDIKPGNILLERGGRALLVDLGLAVADDDPLLTKGGGTLGTPHYISPEQARDPRTADVQSDLWSLGATMYHAVCGKPPFAGESVAEILSAVLYAKIPDPTQAAPYLSRGCALVLRKCLTRDRAHRYATPAELIADLERVRERRAPLVARAGLEPLDRDWRSIRRVAALVGLVAAGLAGVWLIALATGRDPPVSAEIAREPARPDPIERLANAASGPAAGLSAAIAEIAELGRSPALPSESRARLDEVRERVWSRIETELWEFERAAETDLTRKLSAREFEAAERLVAGGLAQELSSRIGGEKLPAPLDQEFEHWLSRQAERVRVEREQSLADFGAALARHFDDEILPRVDELAHAGDWRSARDLLTLVPRTAATEAGLSMQGLADADLARATGALQTRLVERRARLDEAWTALDEELRTFVQARISSLKQALTERKTKNADDVLRAEWEAELGSRGLWIRGSERFPLGVPRVANEELAHGMQELAALESQLGEDDARLRLSELEDEILPLWSQRLYAEAARTYAQAVAEPWSATLRGRLEATAEEARRLDGLVLRAAAGVRARDGQMVTLQLGTIAFPGRLQAHPDPLTQGFRMKPEHGQERNFVLRGTAPDAALLPGGALESLADLPRAAAASPSDRVLLALFRWREGVATAGLAEAAKAAQQVLDAGPLPSSDPLLVALEGRLSAALSHAESPAGERRRLAVEKLRLLRREALESSPRDRKMKRIEGVLELADALTPEEQAEVRALRGALVQEATPSTVEDFARVFKLPRERIEFLPGRTRAALRFDFGTGPAGTFERGSWRTDGTGWIAARRAADDAEMLALPAPTLALRDPLRPQAENLEIRIEFDQPPDAHPDLLLVSAAGFHVVLTGGGRRSRCLVETGDVADAVAHARAEKGPPYEGITRNRRYELRLALNRTTGRALVELSGKKVIEVLQLPPRGDEKNLSLVVRSFEPVRIVTATVEGARR